MALPRGVDRERGRRIALYRPQTARRHTPTVGDIIAQESIYFFTPASMEETMGLTDPSDCAEADDWIWMARSRASIDVGLTPAQGRDGSRGCLLTAQPAITSSISSTHREAAEDEAAGDVHTVRLSGIASAPACPDERMDKDRAGALDR
jgi:hypothetical protein